MRPKMNQPDDNHQTLPLTMQRHGTSQASASQYLPSCSPLTLPCPGENVTAHHDVAKPDEKSAPDQRTVPFMTTLRQPAGSALPELMTLPEICAFLKVKPSYIYSLTSTDRIPHRKFGGVLRFVKAEILQWLDRGRRGPRMSEPTMSGR